MSPTTTFDQRLDAARRGEVDALEWIWNTYAGPVRGFLQARGTPEVDEVVNEVFLGVFAGLAGFTGREPMFRAWIYRVARNKRADVFRRLARRATTEPLTTDAVGGDVEDEALGALDDADLRSLLEVLTPEQRDVIVLRFIADLSIEQVALALDRGPTAVKALQHRAIAQLRKRVSVDPHPLATSPTM